MQQPQSAAEEAESGPAASASAAIGGAHTISGVVLSTTDTHRTHTPAPHPARAIIIPYILIQSPSAWMDDWRRTSARADASLATIISSSSSSITAERL
jgi:hypothetical protein